MKKVCIIFILFLNTLFLYSQNKSDGVYRLEFLLYYNEAYNCKLGIALNRNEENINCNIINADYNKEIDNINLTIEQYNKVIDLVYSFDFNSIVNFSNGNSESFLFSGDFLFSINCRNGYFSYYISNIENTSKYNYDKIKELIKYLETIIIYDTE